MQIIRYADTQKEIEITYFGNPFVTTNEQIAKIVANRTGRTVEIVTQPVDKKKKRGKVNANV